MAGALAQPQPNRPAMAGAQIDVGVHGVLGLRLIDARPPDVAALSLQLGARLERALPEPDIVVEFVEELDRTRLRHLDSPHSYFGEDGLLRLSNGTRQAGIDFRGIGRRCRIVCETGIGNIPLLDSIADVSILSKGFAAMHASAFVHRGRGIVTTGWTHGGKTTAMLAFARRGATFVSDDRLWIRRDGEEMFGFSGAIALRDRHLGELSEDSSLRSSACGAPLRILRRMESEWAQRARCIEGSSLASKVIRRGVAGLRRHLTPSVRPEQLFDRVSTTHAARPETVFVMIRKEHPGIRVEPLATQALTACAWSAARQALNRLSEHYVAFRFAYPGLRNAWLEEASQLHHEVLSSALRTREAYAVYHSAGTDLARLYRQMEPFS